MALNDVGGHHPTRTAPEAAYGPPKRAMTGAERRRQTDARHRQAGRVRFHAWLPAERLEDLDALVKTWNFSGKAEALDVAIRFLRKQSDSMSAIEL